MKKTATKKLQLSRETLRDLKRSDAQYVAGGFVPSTGTCQSCPWWVCETESCAG
jgi:hypothetical protein